jgi:type VI secretion system protein ImpB
MISIQKKLSKERKPRIHITYDVETEGAVEKKELPFVVGAMGDYSGNNPGQAKKAFKGRKFVQIDADNFDEVMHKIQPGVSLKVKNTLADDDSEMKVDLQFNSIEDFEPHNIAQQIPALKKLLETRKKLTELLSKADISQDLEEILEQLLQDQERIKKLSGELEQQTSITEENQ